MNVAEESDPALRSLPVHRIRLGDGRSLLLRRDGSKSATLADEDATLLQLCERLEPNALRATRLARELPPGAITREEIRSRLDGLRAAGWLESVEEIVDTIGGDSDFSRIETVCWVTKDRPVALRASLESFASHFTEWHRAVDYVVCDDSAEPDNAELNRQSLAGVAKRYGVPCRYAGYREKAEFVNRLARASDVEPSLLSFAFGDRSSDIETIGGNRNALLLDVAGSAVLSLDDDAVCRVSRHPEESDRLVLGGTLDPSDYWFLENRTQSRGAATIPSADLLGTHECWLGRSVAALTKLAFAQGKLDVGGANQDVVAAIQNGARVAITVAGVIGDSGIPTHSGFLWGTSPQTLDRLLQSEAMYETALSSREVLRVVPSPTLVTQAQCMSHCWGLDARSILPPFVPIGRNEDGAFGALLWLIDDGALVAHVPVALMHDSRAKAGLSHRSPFVARSLNDMVLSVISGHAPVPGRRSVPQRLCFLSRFLGEIEALDVREFDLYLHDRLAREASVFFESISTLTPGGPGYHRWRQDVDSCCEETVALLQRRDVTLPMEFKALGMSEADALRRSHEYLGSLGRLVGAWSAIFEAATRLRREGSGLSRPLEL